MPVLRYVSGAAGGVTLTFMVCAHASDWRWHTSAAATFDVLANVGGGLETGVEIPGNFDLVSNLEYRRAERAPRHRARVYLLGNVGGNFSERRSGDVQTVSSIEAPNTVKLFEAWYEFEAPSGGPALLVGLHDAAGEFDVLERAQLQLNSSFGTGPTLSQAGASIFPATAPGVRLRMPAGQYGQFAVAVYDGVPGDPSDPYSTQIHFDRGDGLFAIAEASLAHGEGRHGRKLALGGWHSSAEFEDPLGRVHDANSGAYLIGESFLPGIMDERLGAFVQLGVARGDRNVFSGYAGAGVHVHAPLPGRDHDAASISLAHARLGDAYRRAAAHHPQAETTIELTYLAQLTQWLALQPDIQIIIDPGADPAAGDVVVLGLRVVVSLD